MQHRPLPSDTSAAAARRLTRPPRGFTLVEALTYVAILSVVTVGSLSLLFSLDDLFFQYRAEQALFRSATMVLERVLVEARQADALDPGVSELATSTEGVLALTTPATTTVFARTPTGDLTLTQNGTAFGSLLQDGVTADGFTVFHYPMTAGETVRVKLTLTSRRGEYEQTRTFYTAAVIRGSYE